MKLKMTCAAIAAAIAAVSAAGSASAQDATVAFNIAGTTDYVFRGFSQTDQDPAISGGVDVSFGGYYAGVWASNVDFGDDTKAEVDAYGGYRAEIGGLNFDVGAIAYLYEAAPNGADYNYVEAKLAASRAFGPVTAGAAVYYSPDFFGADEEATYLEGTLSYSPIEKWTVSGAVGKQYLDVNDDYVTWNAGVSYAITDNLVADVRYYDTDVDSVPLADDRFVGTIKVLF